MIRTTKETFTAEALRAREAAEAVVAAAKTVRVTGRNAGITGAEAARSTEISAWTIITGRVEAALPRADAPTVATITGAAAVAAATMIAPTIVTTRDATAAIRAGMRGEAAASVAAAVAVKMTVTTRAAHGLRKRAIMSATDPKSEDAERRVRTCVAAIS
jgi:hypothetical protein